MGILGIIWDLLMWGVGIFCSAVGLGVGILASYVIYGTANYIGRTISLNLNRSLVDFLLRTVLFVVSFVFLSDCKSSFKRSVWGISYLW